MSRQCRWCDEPMTFAVPDLETSEVYRHCEHCDTPCKRARCDHCIVAALRLKQGEGA